MLQGTHASNTLLYIDLRRRFMKIQSYQFGEIKVNNKTYHQDIIIFPERVKSSWWRKEGHNLAMVDIQDVLEAKPDVLIIGQGYYGIMKVSDAVCNEIKNRGIELYVKKTNQAVEMYNHLQDKRAVIAALHLTC
jgi:hypothetical protein